MQMLNEILIDYYQNTKQEQLKRTVDEMPLNQKATVTKQSEGIKRKKRKVKEHMIVQEPKQGCLYGSSQVSFEPATSKLYVRYFTSCAISIWCHYGFNLLIDN